MLVEEPQYSSGL